MESALHERPLTVQEAYDALDAFGRAYGRVRLLLLMHASVPQSFRADLLNLLKVNFLADETGADLTVDCDVLLSPIVQPGAAGYYRLDPEVRRHCLALLDATYRDRPVRRSVDVARLLLAYAESLERQAGLRLDPLLAEYLSIQRWVAASFIDPDASAEAFASALNGVLDKDASAAALKLGGITAAISIPLGGHQSLLAYARSVDAISRGDSETGRRLMDWMGDREIHVGGVTLRPVRELLGRLDVLLDHAESSPPRARPLLVRVPDRPGIINGREGYLADVRGMLVGARNREEAARASRARVVSITGPDGSGKWALANALAHDETVQRAFSDGIVWLDEDGMGYPTVALEEYATAAGVSDLIDRSDGSALVNRARFRDLFASAAVLFIADQRSASDMAPTLMNDAGPSCAVLRLMSAGEKRAPGSIELGPLERVYAEHSLVRRLGGSFSVAGLVWFTDGNPLVTRLVEFAVSQRWGSEGQRRNAEAIGRATRSERVRDNVSLLVGLIADSLSDSEVELVREMSKLPANRTQFDQSELGSFGISDPDTFVSVLYEGIDVLGRTIRIHPLIRSAVEALAGRRSREPLATETAPTGEKRSPRTSGKIFVSYARTDRTAAQRIIETMRNIAGTDAVHVEDEGASSGDLFQGRVETAIRAAALFLPVLSRRALQSEWVRREWQTALDESRQRPPSSPYIIPIAVDDISTEARALPRGLAERQWFFARDGVLSSRDTTSITSAIRDYRRIASPRTAAIHDHAIVMSVSDYKGLNAPIPRAGSGSDAFREWLMRAQGVPAQQVHVLSDRAAANALTNESFLRLLAPWASLPFSREPRAGRRLYVYFSGLVATAENRELVLVTGNAQFERMDTIPLRQMVDWFRDSVLFDEIVVCIDGVDLVSSAPFRSTPIPLVMPPTKGGRESAFVVTARSEGQIPPTSLTTVLLTGLAGQAADPSGRVTASSVAAFLREYAGRPGWPQMDIQQSGREIVFVETARPA